MPTLDDIKKTTDKLDGITKFYGFKEFKALPDILWEDEALERVVQGQYNGGMGILCATNKRLVFIDKGLIYGLKVEDFPYDTITSIQYETGLVFGSIKIFASGNKSQIKNIDKKQAKDFGDYIRARTTEKTNHVAASNPSKEDAATSMEQKISALERLAKLKDQGILTDEELQTEKQKIMTT